VIIPEKGRFFEARDGEQIHAPVGSARIVAGGDFTGFRSTLQDVRITERAQEITLTLRREPHLRVHFVNRGTLWFWIQAGDESAGDLDGPLVGEDFQEMAVPPGVPITVFAWLADGELRRVSLPPIEADTDVDLEAASSILRHGMDAAESRSIALSFEVVDETGRPVSAPQGEMTPVGAGLFQWTVPVHDTYQMAFAAEGFTTVYREEDVPLLAPDRAERIVLTRRARLHVGGGATLVEGFQGRVEPAEDGFVIDAAAGPLTIVVAREGGPRIALDLVLAPGESRSIELR
jgi:hypothetical protein